MPAHVGFVILLQMFFSSSSLFCFFIFVFALYAIVLRNSFPVLLFYLSVAVTGGLSLNTVALYDVPVLLSLRMQERTFDASELFCRREPVQTHCVPSQALREGALKHSL